MQLHLIIKLSVCLYFQKGSLCARASHAKRSRIPERPLSCREVRCVPHKRKLFHFQVLSLFECERRSFCNIRLFQPPSLS